MFNPAPQSDTPKQKKRKKEKGQVAVESAVDLDISDLTKHTVNELRQYCRERKIAVGGRRKQDFVSAINTYLATSKQPEKIGEETTLEKADKPKKRKTEAEDFALPVQRPPLANPNDEPSTKKIKTRNAEGGIHGNGNNSVAPAIKDAEPLAGMDVMSRLELREEQAGEVCVLYSLINDTETRSAQTKYTEKPTTTNNNINVHLPFSLRRGRTLRTLKTPLRENMRTWTKKRTTILKLMDLMTMKERLKMRKRREMMVPLFPFYH